MYISTSSVYGAGYGRGIGKLTGTYEPATLTKNTYVFAGDQEPVSLYF